MTIKEDIQKKAGILDEGIMMTISHPFLSKEGIRLFDKELKRWKEIGFIDKWERNNLLTSIKIYIKDLKKPYKINIKGMVNPKHAEGSTRKERLKSMYFGKIKSPFRLFYSFNQVGFYTIIEKLFDVIEDDVTKGRTQKALKLDEKEAEEWEKDFYEKLKLAKHNVNVYRKLDSGDFNVNIGMSINGE